MSARRALAGALLAGVLAVGGAACSSTSDHKSGATTNGEDLQPQISKLRLEVEQLRQEVLALRQELAAATGTTDPLGTDTTTPAGSTDTTQPAG